MIPPLILAGIEESVKLAGLRIDACNVRPFVTVAVSASNSEICRCHSASVLLRDDVVDLGRNCIVSEWCAAILTASARAPAHLGAELHSHAIFRRFCVLDGFSAVRALE